MSNWYYAGVPDWISSFLEVDGGEGIPFLGLRANLILWDYKSFLDLDGIWQTGKMLNTSESASLSPHCSSYVLLF